MMKTVNALLKLLGFFLLNLVVIAALLVVVAMNATAVLNSPLMLKQAVHKYWIADRSPLVELGKDYAARQVNSLPKDKPALWFWRVMNTFDNRQWRALTDYVVPVSVEQKIVDDLIEQWARWWNSPDLTRSPQVVLNLAPLKAHLRANAGKITDWFLAQVPPCSLKQDLEWGKTLVTQDWATAPLCLPPIGKGELRAMLVRSLRAAPLPSRRNLLLLAGIAPRDLQALKANYRAASHSLPYIAGAIAAFWVLGILLMGGGWRGRLLAAGLSLLGLAGEMVFLGYLAVPLAGFVATRYAPANLPHWAVIALVNTLKFYFYAIFHPLLKQSLIPAAVGVLALIPPILVKSK